MNEEKASSNAKQVGRTRNMEVMSLSSNHCAEEYKVQILAVNQHLPTLERKKQVEHALKFLFNPTGPR